MRLLDCKQITALGVLLLASAVGCSNHGIGATSGGDGRGTKELRASVRLLDLDGNPFDLWKQSAAPATVVVFTRSDCPISNRFAPEIRRLYEKYHPQGANFYLIHVDPREQPETIGKHLKEYEYPCQGLRDPEHTLVAYCKATVTPEAAVFGRDGAIAYVGRINDLYADLGRARTEPTTHELADAIEATIQVQPVATPRTKAVGCTIADLKE